jgi:CO/xanthine dehydrogenase FAD-binding subunit
VQRDAGGEGGVRKVLLPQSPDELWSCLNEYPEAMVYAGGTDLLVNLRAGLIDPPSLVCLERIGLWRGVREETSHLWLGACTTHAELLRSPLVHEHLPLLAAALAQLGSPLIRNMGTLGGNICTASPAGDSLPPLYVMQAEVELHSAHGCRRLPLESFITDPGQTQRQLGEILSGVRVRKPEGTWVHHFEKVGQRRALACSVASLAARLKVSDAGVIQEAHLAWGSVGPTVVTSSEVEGLLSGRRLTLEVLDEAASMIRSVVSPIDDVRASADYRREVSGRLLRRLASLPGDHSGETVMQNREE